MLKKIRGPFLAFLGVVVLTLVLSACSQAGPSLIPCNEMAPDTTGAIPDLGGCELRVAVENAYQPFNFIDTETGEGVGYDYDAIAEICNRLNCVPDFIETSWDAMVAVMSGEGELSAFDVGAD